MASVKEMSFFLSVFLIFFLQSEFKSSQNVRYEVSDDYQVMILL